MYISLLHNTSQKRHLSKLGLVPNHIIHESSTSGPMPSTTTIVLVPKGLFPIYNHITKNKTCGLGLMPSIYV